MSNSLRDRLRALWLVLTRRALVYEPDPFTDGKTPLMCREAMAQGERFCERPEGHGGAHNARATLGRYGAKVSRHG